MKGSRRDAKTDTAYLKTPAERHALILLALKKVCLSMERMQDDSANRRAYKDVARFLGKAAKEALVG